MALMGIGGVHCHTGVRTERGLQYDQGLDHIRRYKGSSGHPITEQTRQYFPSAKLRAGSLVGILCLVTSGLGGPLYRAEMELLRRFRDEITYRRFMAQSEFEFGKLYPPLRLCRNAVKSRYSKLNKPVWGQVHYRSFGFQHRKAWEYTVGGVDL